MGYRDITNRVDELGRFRGQALRSQPQSTFSLGNGVLPKLGSCGGARFMRSSFAKLCYAICVRFKRSGFAKLCYAICVGSLGLLEL